MSFNIAFLPVTVDEEPDARLAVIVLGEFRETFLASLEHWSEDDYTRQWDEGASRIVSGHATSCLISSIRDPRTTIGVAWWTLYRHGELIFVQNAIRFFGDLDHVFDETDPYRSVPERTVVSPDGQISEWVVSAEDVKAWVLSRGIDL